MRLSVARMGLRFCRLAVVWLTLSFYLLPSFSASYLHGQKATEVLDNAAIVKMVQAHVGVPLILEQIRTSPGTYVLTSSSLIRLHNLHVPDPVISAMQAKQNGLSLEPVQVQPPNDVHDGNGIDAGTKHGWEIVDWIDPLTEKHESAVSQTVSAVPRGTFVMQVACDENEAVVLRITGLPNNPPLSRSCDKSALRIDDKVFPRGYLPCGVAEGGRGYGFGLVGSISKSSQQQGDRIGAMIKSIPADDAGDKAKNDTTADMMSMLVNVLGGGAAKTLPNTLSAVGLPQMNDLLNGRSLRLEVPFADGTSSYMDASLTDPAFMAYKERCVASSPTGLGTVVSGASMTTGDSPSVPSRASQIASALESGDANYAQANYDYAIADYGKVLSLDGGNEAANAGLVKSKEIKRKWGELNLQLARAGEVVDPKTSLMWTLNDNGRNVNWKEAKEYCQGIRTGGFADWRVPAITELEGLYDASSVRNTVPLRHTERYSYGGQIAVDQAGSYWPYHINGGIILTGHSVWSGTSASNDRVSFFYYSIGKASEIPGGFKRTMRALCVRPSELVPEPVTN